MSRQAVLRLTVLFFLCACSSLPSARSADFAGSETCADCHSDIFETWKSSIHAGAFSNDAFQRSWKDHAGSPECLACHTTGHETGTPRFAHAGVTCESCHGPMSPGHGDGSVAMPIPASAEMCRSCHEKTYQEWKLSAHGENDIRCFDCHNVHAQGLRAGGGDALCGSCHSDRLTDFAHSTHRVEGLECSTCHMPRARTHGEAIEGTGASGHALSVGAEVCSRCHEDTVHKSGKLPQLRERVTQINQQMVAAGVDNVFDLNERVKGLEWRLARARQSGWVVALLFLMLGLSLGWLGGWYVYRRRGRRGRPGRP